VIQAHLVQGFDAGGLGHGHADQVLGLLGGLFRFVHVYPGVLVADIGHFEQVLVQAGIPDGLLEQGFVGARGAGGHHHAVDAFFLDDRFHVVLGVLTAGEQVVLHVDHVGQIAGIIPDRRHIGDAADVDAAVADERRRYAVPDRPRPVPGAAPLVRVSAQRASKPALLAAAAELPRLP
jgi:hypothetical protein